MAFEGSLGGGGHGGGHHGGGHGGGHHGGGHHRSYWGRGGWGGGYPWYYDSYPTVYAEPIYLTQEIKGDKPDCGDLHCPEHNDKCPCTCPGRKPLTSLKGLGTLTDTLGSLPSWVLVVGAAIAAFGVLRYFGR